MGMAASQARLLTITARQHDVEYKAQSIQEAKLRLATQQDEVYKEYLAALDATTLTVKDWEGNLKTATFNNLCGKNAIEVATGNQYVFRDSRGALIVPNDIKELYELYKLQNDIGDAYDFAFYALGASGDISSAEMEISQKYGLESILEIVQECEDSLKRKGAVFTDPNATVADTLSTNGNLKNLVQQWVDEYDVDGVAASTLARLDKIYDSTRYKLYKSHAQEIWDEAGCEGDFDQTLFDYYVKWFKALEAEGGFCTSIDDYDSILPNGDANMVHAANDSEWLQNMIKCGKITVDLIIIDNKTGALSFSSTGVPSDSILEYTTTTTIDKSAMAKAEAEYEHKNRQINQKDKQFDMELSKLDTERSALAKQYESLTKVIDDNIERTFGIFS